MDTSKGRQSTFITNLQIILNNQNYFDTIRPINKGFLILNKTKLEQEILGSHFKHGSFSSFRRSLNKYGFIYGKSEFGYMQYTNEKFQKDQICNLKIKSHEKIEAIPNEEENFNLFFDLKQLQQHQMLMIASIKKMTKQQNDLCSFFTKFLLAMLKGKIYSKKRGEKLNIFICKFLSNLNSNNFSQYLIQQYQKAVAITQEAYDEDFFQNKCIHYVPLFYLPKETIILDQNILKVLGKKDKKYLKQEEKENNIFLKESTSNLSNYFDF